MYMEKMNLAKIIFLSIINKKIKLANNERIPFSTQRRAK